LLVAEDRSENFAQLLLPVRRDFQAKFLFQRHLGFVAKHVPEFRPQHLADGSVELERLGHAHPMKLDGDDEENVEDN
jgi:hypothetical protein